MKEEWRTLIGPRGKKERVRIDLDAPELKELKAKYEGKSPTKKSEKKAEKVK